MDLYKVLLTFIIILFIINITKMATMDKIKKSMRFIRHFLLI